MTTYKRALCTALLALSVTLPLAIGPVGCARQGPPTTLPTTDAQVANSHTISQLPPDAFPIPPWCMTEDEGTLTQYEDGSISISETGCVLDAESRTWR